MSNTRNLGELLQSDGEVPSSKIDSVAATKLTGTVATARLPSAALYTHPNHSGDVISVADGAMTIQTDAVDIAMLSASGTASNTTFLRGDNAWAVPIGGVTSVNSETGAITAAHIATAVEAASDSNTFTDADHTKLNAIEASADVTDTTNVVAALTAGTGITISGGGTVAAGPIALTTVQTAANQSAHLALTAQEGDIVVRSDENKTYCHNGGSAGNMTDYTLLATPTDVVLSVAGNTGAVTAAQIATAVEAASGSNTFTDADHTKLNAIEASADVTDATNVTAAGALMDSEVTNLAAVKSFAASDYATAAQGTLAAAALPKSGGAMTGAITTNSTFDGVDIATRDAILTSTTTTAGAALPKAGGTMTGRINGADGTEALPMYRFATAASGMYMSGSDNIGFSQGGNKKLEITTAGATVTGKLGIGITPSAQELEVYKSAGATVKISGGANDSDAVLRLQSGNASGESSIFVGDEDDIDVGNIDYLNAGNHMTFTTGASERMRINGSGHVGIGQTSPSSANSIPTFLHIGNSSTTQSSIILEDDESKWEICHNGDIAFRVGTTAHFRIGTTMIQASGWNWRTISTSDPTATSNPDAPGTGVGHLWLNSSSGEAFVCNDSTTNGNGWYNIGEGSGGVVAPYTVDYVVVAGGAGAGGDLGGGGGAGGYRSSWNSETSGGGGNSESAITVSVGTSYTVTIGGGGGGNSSNGVGGSGGNSVFGSITSNGGGGGAGDAVNPNSGGSGGGASSQKSPGGSGTSGQGYAGGSFGSFQGNAGGGGGGAAAVGQNAHATGNGGNGGSGRASTITGSSLTLGGGGGAGGDSRHTFYAPGTGGAGGGGNGGTGGYNISGHAGSSNTGGGGGAGTQGGGDGANGGSGRVLLRMPTSKYSGTTSGSPSVTTSGSDTILSYTSSGSYTG